MRAILDFLSTRRPSLKHTETQETQINDVMGTQVGRVVEEGPAPAQPGRLQASLAEMHGRYGDPSWEAPRLAVRCDEEARPGYATKKAHEYLDEPDVLLAKVRVLAGLIRRSRNCVAYTGAGISTASGIGDYASRAGKASLALQGQPEVRSPLAAMPTLAHRVLAGLYHANLLKYWIQQNHDGLPQKAGVPQRALNEIHGAWFDPSNPVVPMSGQLRTDLFEDLLAWEERADLVLAMGTSMCGMNADRVATSCAERATKKKSRGALGTVIVTLQCTQYDGLSALRIFARIDDVMRLLATELSLEIPEIPSEVDGDDVFTVPYDRAGAKSDDTQQLDLRYGSKVMITMGPYKDCYGLITGKSKGGHYKVTILVPHPVSSTLAPVPRMLGAWWPQELAAGTAPYLPLVNVTSVDGLPDKLRQLEADLA